jgi:hypothetical protein
MSHKKAPKAQMIYFVTFVLFCGQKFLERSSMISGINWFHFQRLLTCMADASL